MGFCTRNVLIVDQDEQYARDLAFYLQSELYRVLIVQDRPQSIEVARVFEPDVVVIGPSKRALTAINTARRIRELPGQGSTAFLFVVADGTPFLALAGALGGTVARSMSPSRVLLRIKALIERTPAGLEVNRRVELGRFTLYPEVSQVDVNGHLANLSVVEYKLLTRLLQAPGHVVIRSELLRSVWNVTEDNGTRTLDKHAQRLRKKLGPYGDWLETVAGVGLRLNSP